VSGPILQPVASDRSRPGAKQYSILVVSLLLALLYVFQCWRIYRADSLAKTGQLHYVTSATKIEPDNAYLHYLQAKLLSVPPHGVREPLPELELATQLNPHEPGYWIELAYLYQSLGRKQDRDHAIQSALNAAPNRPSVAWETGNLLIASGEFDRALLLFKDLLHTDPDLRRDILTLCWRVKPDAGMLLNSLVGSDRAAHVDFLDLLIQRKDPATALVFQHLLDLHGETQWTAVTSYVRYLIQNQQYAEAAHAWNDAMQVYPELQAYREGPNHIVNGGFELPFLNAPMDWVFEPRANIASEIDTSEVHEGNRSLALIFNESRETDLGVSQWVAVEPGAVYEFSAFTRSQDITTADGPKIDIFVNDPRTPLWLSDDLHAYEGWREIQGSFTVPQGVVMVHVAIVRMNSTLIRGRLWLDSFSILARNAPTSDSKDDPRKAKP
jgi:tetratricopeptide (TPR) repeat protein